MGKWVCRNACASISLSPSSPIPPTSISLYRYAERNLYSHVKLAVRVGRTVYGNGAAFYVWAESKFRVHLVQFLLGEETEAQRGGMPAEESEAELESLLYRPLIYS